MRKPTEAQIKKEIETLRKYKNLVRPYTMFGESNEEAIEAQIYVLEEEMDEDDIWEHWDIDSDERMIFHATNAWEWRVGRAKRPSIEWKPLLVT